MQVRKLFSGILSLLTVFTVFSSSGVAFAKDEYPSRLLTRGEAVFRIVETFELGQTKESFLTACYEQPDECFFVFSAMSDFDDIAFEPFLKLYPDVNQKYRYYEAINTASMLGLIHGYLEEDRTPFKPELVMSRIQALKVVLGAADVLRWKEHFELTEEELSAPPVYADIPLQDPENWWYNRYLSFSAEHGITSESDFFRPDEPITVAELKEIMNTALAYSEARLHDPKTLARGNSAE